MPAPLTPYRTPRPVRVDNLSLLTQNRGRNDNNHHQTRDNQTPGDEGDEHDGAARGREFAADDVVLGLEVAVETEEEDEDGCDARQRRGQWSGREDEGGRRAYDW